MIMNEKKFFNVIPSYRRSICNLGNRDLRPLYVRASSAEEAVRRVEEYINSNDQLRSTYIDNSCEAYVIPRDYYYGKKGNLSYDAIFLE